jgi:hypothetical protein
MEYYEAVGSYSKLEQNPATVTGRRVPNSPFFINTFSLAETVERCNCNFYRNFPKISPPQGNDFGIKKRTSLPSN